MKTEIKHLKTYTDSTGDILYECPQCGVYCDEKDLNNHRCTGNHDNVNMIKEFFK